MPSCTSCERRLSPGERYCTACGVPTAGLIGDGGSGHGSSRPGRCPHCDHANRAGAPFCARCGLRIVAQVDGSLPSCPSCGTLLTDETARFCAGCGSRLRGDDPVVIDGATTAPRGAPVIHPSPRLSLLDSTGDVSQVIPLIPGRATLSADRLGLHVGDGLLGGDGAALSIESSGHRARIEPVGSPRALFVFLTAETGLTDGDVLLLGAQVIRYRRVVEDGSTYFADQGTVQVGSLVPERDVAVLEQLRGDGRVRDTLHLWAGRSILIGREEGDWLFSYDRTMSARHAVVACSPEGVVTVRDVGSRNGVALAVRGARELAHGQRVSLGGQLMRVDLA